MIDVWLDDERDPKDHGCEGFRWFKTGESLIAWFREHGMADVRYISLDHDLGSGSITGCDVIEWMEMEVRAGKKPPRSILLHTRDGAGKERMRAIRYSIYAKAKPNGDASA